MQYLGRYDPLCRDVVSKNCRLQHGIPAVALIQSTIRAHLHAVLVYYIAPVVPSTQLTQKPQLPG